MGVGAGVISVAIDPNQQESLIIWRTPLWRIRGEAPPIRPLDFPIEVSELPAFHGHVYDFQTVAACFLYERGRAILGVEFKDDRTNTFQLNSAPSVEALQFLADLVNKEKIARGSVWGVDPFLNETVAMYPFGRWLKPFQTAKFERVETLLKKSTLNLVAPTKK